MAWIEYHEALRDHWKVQRLAKTLDVPYTQALGIISCLWLWAVSNAPSGDLKKFADDEILSASKCVISCKNFKKILSDCGLLDSKERINDWNKHGLKYLESAKKRARIYRKRAGYPEKWEGMRIDVLRRDNYQCGYCGRKATIVDHIVPISKGGKTELSNLSACCKSCNLRKGNKLISEIGFELRNNSVTTTQQLNNTLPNPTQPYRTVPNLTNKKNPQAGLFQSQIDENKKNVSALTGSVSEKLIKPKSPYKVDLKSIEVKCGDQVLDEPAKHKLHNKLVGLFQNRGWHPNLITGVFQSCAARINDNGITPKELYPYFEKTIAKYINENADLISQQSKVMERKEE